jgi:hypothetical protein
MAEVFIPGRKHQGMYPEGIIDEYLLEMNK